MGVPGELTFVGVAQQNVAGAQENYRGMVDAVLSWCPKVPVPIIERALNQRMRKVVRAGNRPWFGLTIKGTINPPGSYTTGTVNLTTGLQLVTVNGGTALPISDVVNTTMTTAPTVIGTQSATLGAVANIDLGDWLTIDATLATEERVVVQTVDRVGKKVTANFSQVHSNGAVVTMSSLVRRQFRVAFLNPIYTVIGVSTASQFYLDQPYGGPTIIGTGYTIYKQIVRFGKIRQVLSLVNPAATYALVINLPAEVLDRVDATRSNATGGLSYVLAYSTPDEVGIPQFELYPAPSAGGNYMFLASRQVDDMVDENDTPPPFIDTDVLINGALADCYRWGNSKMNPYYSESTSRYFDDQFKEGVVAMATEDDNVSMRSLIWEGFKIPVAWGGSEWMRNHDGTTSFSYP